MDNNEIRAKLHSIYDRMYNNPTFLTTGLYSDEKAALDKELKEVQDNCPHKNDDGTTAIEDGYCTVCGRKI